MYWLTVILLVVVNLAALIGVLALSLKIRTLRVATFWRGCLGALAAVPLEVARILLGFGITRWLGVAQGDALLLLLLNLRFFNIPLLVGGGFLGAAFGEPGPQSEPASSVPAGDHFPCRECGRQIKRQESMRHNGFCAQCDPRTRSARAAAVAAPGRAEPAGAGTSARYLRCASCGTEIWKSDAERLDGMCKACFQKANAATR
ncbi:MAG TPA: hypothetical protein VLA96_00815 [Terriglobales bacterium]|nr:hypothetical protein [Terriglobales bacterium]